MNKTQLIEAVAQETRMSKTDAAGAVYALIDTVQTTLKKGDEVSITGFGKFSVTKRPRRTGCNPASGEPITIKALQEPKFAPGATLRQVVNAKSR